MSTIATEVEQHGFGFVQAFHPEIGTAEIAAMLGTVVPVAELLAGLGIPTVQVLSPREPRPNRSNLYSDNYGLRAFPLHTDLAHWARPPRYFILRCIMGDPDVYTSLLPIAEIVTSILPSDLHRAVFSTRQESVSGPMLLGLTWSDGHCDGFRWDSLFLRPQNDSARFVARVFGSPRQADAAKRVSLRDRGDLLIVDNWKMLHGRGPIGNGSHERKIERVYLDRLN